MRLNMRSERVRLGLTAEEASQRIGVHENALLRWEQGKSDPLGSNLIRLAKLYHCSPEYLLGQTDRREGSAIATE